MNSLSILLVVASAATLILGFLAWRLTSSKTTVFNTFAGGASLLFAARISSTHPGAAATFLVPFFVAMLFGGRAFGTLWRSRKEEALRLPSTFLFGVAGAALLASVAAFFAR